MSVVDTAPPITAAEAAELFAPLGNARGVVLAISGGPDSTALLWLAACWRNARERGPALLAVTVDHGLRQASRAEADAVKRLAKRCGIAHRTMRWSGPKPASGLQQAAREARYRLLAEAARTIGADHILTGHTSDDQAETLLIRMSRGSGVTGACGMTRITSVPGLEQRGMWLMRPFLDLPKARLVATVAEAGLAFADDPSNRDPRFTRSRLRVLMPALAGEGLTAARLSQFARRLQRAEAALEAATDVAWAELARKPDGGAGQEPAGIAGIVFDRRFTTRPAEVQVRLLARAIALVGDEGPVELGKLEALHAALTASSSGGSSLRRTLAGAMVTGKRGQLLVQRAPARRRIDTLAQVADVGPSLNHTATSLPRPAQSALE